MRILIVEDDKETRESLRLALIRESFAVDTAADGDKGSFMARTNDYDLIILDNTLPIKKGPQVCKEIRKVGIRTPILMLSVINEISEKVSLLDLGVDDY